LIYQMTTERPSPPPNFEVGQWAVGGGYYVHATFTDGTVERIDGFATEIEAKRWIKNEAVEWVGGRPPTK
jgi:hypothetical protein